MPSSTASSVFFRRIARALAAWRRRRTDRRQLLALGESELRDLGIGRGQIHSLLEGAPSRGRG